MEKSIKKRATSLQMVEVDHRQFAVELISGNVRVNLTQMAKSFGRSKRPNNWLKSQESQDYIKVVSVATKRASADLLEVRRGGTPGNQGTWAKDRRIAIRFAQWLSPEFSVAVDDLLLKLMQGEATVVEPIAGVWPIVQNGVVGYPRKEILEAAGFSPRSGSVNYWKSLYPKDHFQIYRTACISPRLAKMRLKAGQYRQLRLNFNQKGVLHGNL